MVALDARGEHHLSPMVKYFSGGQKKHFNRRALRAKLDRLFSVNKGTPRRDMGH